MKAPYLCTELLSKPHDRACPRYVQCFSEAIIGMQIVYRGVLTRYSEFVFGLHGSMRECLTQHINVNEAMIEGRDLSNFLSPVN